MKQIFTHKTILLSTLILVLVDVFDVMLLVSSVEIGFHLS